MAETKILATRYGALSASKIAELEALGFTVVELPQVEDIRWVTKEPITVKERPAMFEITIKRIETKVVPKREYTNVGTEDAKHYDYVTVEREEAVETEIYSQKVEQLDLAQVVAVVNGIVKGGT